MTLYEKFKKYELPAESVEDFCDKYHRRSAYHERGSEYMAADLQSHLEEFETYGYTIIPRSSTTTGDIVAYYGKIAKGQKVYQHDGSRIYESTVINITHDNHRLIYETDGIAFDHRAIGHSVFLTPQEAEKALNNT